MSAAEDCVGPVPAAVYPLRSNHRLKGVLFLCAGVGIFTIQDVLIKWISGDYPIAQILATRSVVAFVPLFVLAHLEGGLGGIRTRRPGLHAIRAMLLFVSYTAYYLGIAAIPLAEVVSLTYSAPFFIVAMSGPLLREAVRPRQWLAVVGGFLGVLVILRPGTEAMEPAALLPLLSAALYSGAQVMTRVLGTTDRASTMGISHNAMNLTMALVLGLVAGDGDFAGSGHPSLEFLFRAWRLPSLPDLAVMATTGVIFGAASWCLSQGYRVAPPNVVAPFEYTSLIWALLWGFLFWQEVPTVYTVAGVIVIVAAGLFVLGSPRTARPAPAA